MKYCRHYPGYNDARNKVLSQTLQENLRLLDSLLGRDNLKNGATNEDVQQETLRQLELDWRILDQDQTPFAINT